MADEKYSVTMKKKIILDFLKSNNNRGFSQGELTRNLMYDLMYSSESSARVSIGNLLRDMKEEEKVYFVEMDAPKGRLPMKVWFLKDGV